MSTVRPVVDHSTPLAIHLTQGYMPAGKHLVWYATALLTL